MVGPTTPPVVINSAISRCDAGFLIPVRSRRISCVVHVFTGACLNADTTIITIITIITSLNVISINNITINVIYKDDA